MAVEVFRIDPSSTGQVELPTCYWKEKRMSAQEYSKLKIGQEYLNVAIEFFLLGQNLFCSINLAAAAEELLGVHLPTGERNAILAMKAEKQLIEKTGINARDGEVFGRLNEWKNAVKHMDKDRKPTLSIDPIFVAEYHIENALSNFYKLNLKKSSAIWKFEDFKNYEK